MTLTRQHDEGFACRCSDVERLPSENRLSWAYDLLGISSGEWFVSGAVMELTLRYDIDIVGLAASQWYGVDYQPSLTNSDDRTSRGRIQCDRVEDGIALLLKKAFDRWGDYRPGSNRSEDPEEGMRWRSPDLGQTTLHAE